VTVDDGFMGRLNNRSGKLPRRFFRSEDRNVHTFRSKTPCNAGANRCRALGILLLLALPALAARPQLSFTKPVDLPELGLKMRLMPEACGVPLPSPMVRTYEFHKGGRSWKEDLYSPVELWRHSQCAGQWVGRHTNTLVLATITQSLPLEFTRDNVSRAEYEAKAGAATQGPITGKVELARWVADFAGCPDPVERPVSRAPYRISPVVCYSFGKQAPNRLAYVFRLNRSRSDTWMCALFELNPAIDLSLASQAIESEFLGSIVVTLPAREEPDKTPSRAPTVRPSAGPAPARTDDAPPSADMAATRKQVIDSIRNMKGWWSESTEHFIILSNLKGSVKSFVDDIRDELGIIRGAYARSVPSMGANGVAAVIRIPATTDEYVSYVGPDMAWSGGLWSPFRKELLIRPMEAGGSREQRRRVLRVVFHEAFHQYVFYALNQTEPAIWFNEGYAQFFENAEIANGRVRIDEDPQALVALGAIIDGKQVDLARLFRMTHDEFYAGGDEMRARNYALAWALVYYLRKGAPLEPDAPHAGLLDRYVAAMRTNPDGVAATAAMLAGVTVSDLERDFERFWHSPSKRGAARRHDPFAPNGKR
jgi:hypothetical protein